MLTILAKVFVLTDYQEHSCLSVSGIYCLVFPPSVLPPPLYFCVSGRKREEGEEHG